MDLVGLLLAAGAALFLVGEALALVDPAALTFSERLRGLVAPSPTRRVLLAALLILLYTHLVHAWPW